VAQGTGSDWGPYWLGSGEQVSANQAANVEPYVRAAVEHGVPFVFSFGIAGANPHLDTCLGCVRRALPPQRVVARRRRRSGPRSTATCCWPPSPGDSRRPGRPGAALSPRLTAATSATRQRIVALIGPEPVMAALDRGVDGVITGGRSTSACSWRCRCCAGSRPPWRPSPASCSSAAAWRWSPATRAGASGHPGRERARGPFAVAGRPGDGPFLVSHTFYERSHPTQEENPGGLLDLADATYVETSTGIRCEGARWVERPYTVLMEGARREGFRAVSLLGCPRAGPARPGAVVGGRGRGGGRGAPRFADAVRDGRLRSPPGSSGSTRCSGRWSPTRA
jgi:hypothetical protein